MNFTLARSVNVRACFLLLGDIKRGRFRTLSTRRLATADTDFAPHLDLGFNLGHAEHLPLQKIPSFCIFCFGLHRVRIMYNLF